MESSPPSYGSPAASGSLKDPPHKILKVYENIFFNLRQVYFLYSTLHFGEFSRGHGKNNLVLWLAKAIRHFNWLRCELLGLRTNVKQVKPENKKEVRRALAGAAKALGAMANVLGLSVMETTCEAIYAHFGVQAFHEYSKYVGTLRFARYREAIFTPNEKLPYMKVHVKTWWWKRVRIMRELKAMERLFLEQGKAMEGILNGNRACDV